MKQFVFVIRDSVSGVYDRPMVSRSEGEMIRDFGDIARDSKTRIGMHPEHFSLWNIGVYDDNTGMVEPSEPVHVINAVDTLVENVVDIKDAGHA